MHSGYVQCFITPKQDNKSLSILASGVITESLHVYATVCFIDYTTVSAQPFIYNTIRITTHIKPWPVDNNSLYCLRCICQVIGTGLRYSLLSCNIIQLCVMSLTAIHVQLHTCHVNVVFRAELSSQCIVTCISSDSHTILWTHGPALPSMTTQFGGDGQSQVGGVTDNTY